MSPPDKTAYLSKSLYTRGLKCHKSLYLHKYRSELRTEPTAALKAPGLPWRGTCIGWAFPRTKRNSSSRGRCFSRSGAVNCIGRYGTWISMAAAKPA